MRFTARIRTPVAIDGAVAEPFAQQLLRDPSDGRVLDQGGDAEAGSLHVELEADDEESARLHAQLLAERAPGCSVEEVVGS
ncbi:MAG: hypothetical protein JWP95_1879 [Actinotalea sp.]|nr:hypothetical protein [Actinotalea sp.]